MVGQRHTFAIHFESNNIYINIVTFLFYLSCSLQWKPKWLADCLVWLVGWLLQRIWYSIFSHDANEYKYKYKLWKQTVCFVRIFHHFIHSIPSRQMKRMNQIKLGKPTDRSRVESSGGDSRIEVKGALVDNTFAASKMSLSFRMQKSTSHCRANEFIKESMPKNGYAEVQKIVFYYAYKNILLSLSA